ncbi:glycosyltransferase family 2 protein [Bacteroides xylanisolvens]|uniref:glycosyltransferase family 2 protein n=1 Tax=Bacteroides xylanisolvens TaxID=371601 RepID=UPI00374F3772
MQKQPNISIITVNYNNNQGLIKTLESVRKQPFVSYEHIIIDANSTDGSKDTILKYEEKTTHLTYWCSEPDKGIYDGMNKGIERASGEYIYFLNSGDCLTENILQKIPLDGTGYIYGDIKFIGGKKNRIEKAPDKADLVFFLTKSLPHQACFIHNKLFENNKYDTSYKIIADWIHSIQCIIFNECSYKHIPYIIAEYDSNGVSSDYKESQDERLKWLKTTLPNSFYEAFIELAELQQSAFRNVIPILNKTRKFQKRVKKLVMFLYRINNILTTHAKRA